MRRLAGSPVLFAQQSNSIGSPMGNRDTDPIFAKLPVKVSSIMQSCGVAID